MKTRISSWGELDAYLRDRIEDFSRDVTDAEVQVSAHARQRSLGRVAILAELRVLIGPVLNAERRATEWDGGHNER